MPGFFRNHTLAVLSLAAVILYLVAHYTFGSEPARRITNALLIGIDMSIVVLWRAAAFKAWKNGARKGKEKIVLTIWMAWLILLLQRIYAAAYSILGKPTWLMDLPISGLVTAGIAVIGLYAVLAPLYSEDLDEFIVEDVVRAGIVGAATAIAVIIVYFVTGSTF